MLNRCHAIGNSKSWDIHPAEPVCYWSQNSCRQQKLQKKATVAQYFQRAKFYKNSCKRQLAIEFWKLGDSSHIRILQCLLAVFPIVKAGIVLGVALYWISALNFVHFLYALSCLAEMEIFTSKHKLNVGSSRPVIAHGVWKSQSGLNAIQSNLHIKISQRDFTKFFLQ